MSVWTTPEANALLMDVLMRQFPQDLHQRRVNPSPCLEAYVCSPLHCGLRSAPQCGLPDEIRVGEDTGRRDRKTTMEWLADVSFQAQTNGLTLALMRNLWKLSHGNTHKQCIHFGVHTDIPSGVGEVSDDSMSGPHVGPPVTGEETARPKIDRKKRFHAVIKGLQDT